ncbi:MAG: rRNA maturation RNase YbeY [Bacteroidota bacterium]|nr:rRNA maturation RNase YbeY [Saprospiraceae bacterium]
MDFPIIQESEEEQQINFFFEDIDFTPPDENLLTAWLLRAAEEEECSVSEITYIFCSDEHLRKINIDFLNHDYYTDVITFPYDDNSIQGDVFISCDRVRENAEAAGVSFERELSRVMVHGLLHLAGYDDKLPEDKIRMTEREDFHLDYCTFC